MKATVKQLTTATIIALLLMVVNVKAEGIEYTALENENNETALLLEDWMTDSSVWNTDATAFYINQETETGLKLEDWMTNDDSWNINFGYEVEAETGLTLENWMICDSTWNIGNREHRSEFTVKHCMANNKFRR